MNTLKDLSGILEYEIEPKEKNAIIIAISRMRGSAIRRARYPNKQKHAENLGIITKVIANLKNYSDEIERLEVKGPFKRDIKNLLLILRKNRTFIHENADKLIADYNASMEKRDDDNMSVASGATGVTNKSRGRSQSRPRFQRGRSQSRPKKDRTEKEGDIEVVEEDINSIQKKYKSSKKDRSSPVRDAVPLKSSLKKTSAKVEKSSKQQKSSKVLKDSDESETELNTSSRKPVESDEEGSSSSKSKKSKRVTEERSSPASPVASPSSPNVDEMINSLKSKKKSSASATASTARVEDSDSS